MGHVGATGKTPRPVAPPVVSFVWAEKSLISLLPILCVSVLRVCTTHDSLRYRPERDR